jgi:hypothetical protein
MWTYETLKAIMDVIENGTHSMKRVNKSWNIPINSFINHLNGKTKSKKMWPKGVLTKKKRCNSDYMDIINPRMWIIHYPITTKDESYKYNKSKGYTIPRWNTRLYLVVLVQMKTSRNQHTASKRFGSLHSTRANT